METKEMSYNELVINGFMALFFNGQCRLQDIFFTF